MSKPTKAEILEVVEDTEVLLSDMMRRWQDGIPAEIREEIRAAHKPVMDILIRAGRLVRQRPPPT